MCQNFLRTAFQWEIGKREKTRLRHSTTRYMKKFPAAQRKASWGVNLRRKREITFLASDDELMTRRFSPSELAVASIFDDDMTPLECNFHPWKYWNTVKAILSRYLSWLCFARKIFADWLLAWRLSRGKTRLFLSLKHFWKSDCEEASWKLEDWRRRRRSNFLLSLVRVFFLF